MTNAAGHEPDALPYHAESHGRVRASAVRVFEHLDDHARLSAHKPWPLSSIVLAMAGVALIGVGLYFIAWRPAMLPEDVRYMGLSAAHLDAVRPRLEAWLTQVFRVMGGYVLATGVLTMTLAATSFRSHRWGAAIGALLAGAASIGLMTVVNFMIDSDFKWFLLGIALMWASSLGLFWFEKKGAVDSERIIS